MQSLNEILRQSDGRKVLNTKLSELSIFTLWDSVVGLEIAGNASPKRIKNGILYVKTKSPSWAQELSTLGGAIKKNINKASGSDVIKEIRFFYNNSRDEENLNREHDRAPNIGPIKVEKEEQEEINKILESLRDDDLRNGIRAVIVRNIKLNKWRRENGWLVCDKCNSMYYEKSNGCMYCE